MKSHIRAWKRRTADFHGSAAHVSRSVNPSLPPMETGRPERRMLAMTTPTVNEIPLALQPVLPSTFTYVAVREGDPRPVSGAQPPVRRIVD
jgi:hypothetical protein